MRKSMLSMLPTLFLMGCDGPRTCDASPEEIHCDLANPPTRLIVDQRYIPEMWHPTASADWGCEFEVDGGTARFVARGELCTTMPAVDESTDMRLIERRCALPEGSWEVIGPKNSLKVQVFADGGASCTPR